MPTGPNLHLRGFRKRSSLTQVDIARLMGHVSDSSVSRLENGERLPDLKTAFLLEAALGASASQLFRTLYAELAEAVRMRAEMLDDSLSLQSATPEIERRRLELRAVIDRLKRQGV